MQLLLINIQPIGYCERDWLIVEPVGVAPENSAGLFNSFKPITPVKAFRFYYYPVHNSTQNSPTGMSVILLYSVSAFSLDLVTTEVEWRAALGSQSSEFVRRDPPIDITKTQHEIVTIATCGQQETSSRSLAEAVGRSATKNNKGSIVSCDQISQCRRGFFICEYFTTKFATIIICPAGE